MNKCINCEWLFSCDKTDEEKVNCEWFKKANRKYGGESDELK